MKILHRYILINILIHFIVGLGIFTFILFLGQILKLSDLLSKGIHPLDLIHLFSLLLPYFFSVCIPMAFLTAILLVFGRLSQDNELVAMRSSGISLVQITYPIIILSVLLSIICFRLNDKIIPETHYSARKLVTGFGSKNPAGFIEAGSFIDIFPNHIIYVRERKKNDLKKVVIYQTMENGQVKTITAKEGKIRFDQKSKILSFELINGNIQEPRSDDIKNFFNISFGRYSLSLDTSHIFQNPTMIHKKHKDMSIAEIKEKASRLKAQGVNTTPLLTEIQKKISISFSCLAFALIGIPLGIRTHRSEKTVGIAISLLLVFTYYLIIIVGKAFDEDPRFFPHLLMWVPNIILISLGSYLFKRMARV